MAKLYGTQPGAEVPASPTNLAADTITAGYVVLSWDEVAGAVRYQVYRNGVPIGQDVTIPTDTDYSVDPTTTYSYRVQAFNSAGASDLSEELAVTTYANSLPLWELVDQSLSLGQAYALDLATLVTDTDQQTLTYSLVSNGVPGLVLTGSIYSGTPTVVGTNTPVFSVFDGYDTVEASAVFTTTDPDTTAPSVPGNVLAEVVSSTVTVTWAPSTDATGVLHYRIYRNGVFRATSTVSPYSEVGLSEGSYSYTVSAVDASTNANESVQSSPSVIVVGAANPDAPITFTATPVSGLQINLSWAPGPNGSVPTDYDLDYSIVSASGPWVSIPFTGTATTYTHSGLVNAQTYYYRIRASRAGIYSGYSTTAAIAAISASGWPVVSGGPLWLHGPGQVGTYSRTDPTSGLYKWENNVAQHAADIVVCWSALSGGNTTWSSIESGWGTTGANFKSAVQNLPPTRPIVHCYPAMPDNLGDQLSNKNLQNPGVWDSIAEGRYDDHYIAMAENMKAYMAPYGRLPASIALRFGWEMTGDWYPWSMPNNVTGWKAAWNHLIPIIRQHLPGVKIDLSVHRRRPGYNNVGASGWQVTAADGRKGYDLSQWLPADSSYDFFACSQHDWSKVISGYNGGVATSVVDEYTWNYLHLNPPTNQNETGLQEACDWARAHGKGFGISEWAIQYISAGSLPASLHPSFFLTKIFNFLNENNDIVWWDGYLVNTETNMSGKTGAAYNYTYGGQTFNAAVTYRTLWS